VERTIRERVDGRARDGKTGDERRTELFHRVKPVVETKSMKRSGRAQQVPTPVSERRGRYRAVKWIREAARKRAKKSGRPWADARRKELRILSNEVYRIDQGRTAGKTVACEPLNRRTQTHRAAKANRVYVGRR
jgi:small subunit ribosomal protein S7